MARPNEFRPRGATHCAGGRRSAASGLDEFRPRGVTHRPHEGRLETLTQMSFAPGARLIAQAGGALGEIADRHDDFAGQRLDANAAHERIDDDDLAD